MRPEGNEANAVHLLPPTLRSRRQSDNKFDSHPARHAATTSGMASVHVDGALIHVETDSLTATVATEGYVTGVKDGTFVDKKTGAHDLGYGFDIVDFPLEPEPSAEP